MRIMEKKAIIFILLISVFASFFALKANATFDCLNNLSPSSSQPDKDYCQNELTQIEAEYASLLKQLENQNKQSDNYASEVKKLTLQINALKTKIKARALVIAQLKVNITEKVNTINSLSKKIDREHESLAQLLRNTNEFDNNNLVSLILSNNSVSNFYGDLESYNSIKQAIKDSVDIINGVKTQTEVAKQDLEKKQNAETDAKAELENAQKAVAKSEAEKKQLLAISKNKEAAYKQLAADKKMRADRIRAALFPLRDAQAIPFGVALQYAEQVEKKTGVRPALVLAILQQESSLGANVGTCNRLQDSLKWQNIMPGPTHYNNYLKNGKTCDGPNSPCSYRDDQSAFLRITDSLNISPEGTPLSCPSNGSGWGGAMGPSQFIPSTWELMKNRLGSNFGIDGDDVNPWNPQHAVLATAMYMADLGAMSSSYSSEIKAACKYYGTGGATCVYGRQVMAKAENIQLTMIDPLEGF